MGTLVVGTLGVALHTLPAPATPPPRAHPPLSVNDTIAFRAAVQHGRALVRNQETVDHCREERENQYIRLDRLYTSNAVRPGPLFGSFAIGSTMPPDESELYDDNRRLSATGANGIIETIAATVSDGNGQGYCHATSDWAIECPPTCSDTPLEACAILHRRLDRDWWPERRAIWRARHENLRASLIGSNFGGCALLFERHVDPTRWIGMEADVEIPIGLAGKPISWLRMKRRWDDAREWQAAATGDFITAMTVSVTVERGVIAEVRAVGYQTPEAVEELFEITKGLPVTVRSLPKGEIEIVARESR